MTTNRITPFIKRMRVNGGTLFSFNSSIEDIGLNINEKNNNVKISHFALLNIPSIENSNNIDQNWFNVNAIAGAWKYENNSLSIKDGRILIAESFQNYASNFETILLDQDTYNPELQDTVTERVFWKWLKETGAIRWETDSSSNWIEDTHTDYNSIVKYIGLVSAGNVRRDTFGTYNETYIMVPTSHGQTEAFFKQVTDSNYDHGFSIGELTEKINGRSNWLQPHPDGLSFNAYYDFVDSSTTIGSYTLDVSSWNYTGSGWWYTSQGIEPPTGTNYYLIDNSTYIGDPSSYNTDLTYTGTSGFEFRRSNIDCMSLELDLNKLKTIYNDTTLTYNKIATTNSINNSFDFNTMLIYYTVFNATGDVKLATNLLGVMFLDAPSGNSSAIGSGGILLPSIEKIQSQSTGFGTSYSLRLNIKSDNTIDDTNAVIIDYSTSDIAYAEDFNDTMAELNKTIQILNQQTSTINHIATNYINLDQNQTSILNRLNSQQNTINAINLIPDQLRSYHIIQDNSIAINTEYNLIQDTSIFTNKSYNTIQDVSISDIILNQSYKIAQVDITFIDLANIDTSINGIELLPDPGEGKYNHIIYPIMYSYAYNGTTYSADDGGDNRFYFYYDASTITVTSTLSVLASTANRTNNVAAFSINLDASGAFYVRTNGTYSGLGGPIQFNIPYLVLNRNY